MRGMNDEKKDKKLFSGMLKKAKGNAKGEMGKFWEQEAKEPAHKNIKKTLMKKASRGR
jgi:hypothetical protein